MQPPGLGLVRTAGFLRTSIRLADMAYSRAIATQKLNRLRQRGSVAGGDKAHHQALAFAAYGEHAVGDSQHDIHVL